MFTSVRFNVWRGHHFNYQNALPLKQIIVACAVLSQATARQDSRQQSSSTSSVDFTKKSVSQNGAKERIRPTKHSTRCIPPMKEGRRSRRPEENEAL